MEDADCDEREKEVVEGLDETKADVEGLDCDECEKEVKRLDLDETKAGVKGLDCDEREKEVVEGLDETKADVEGLDCDECEKEVKRLDLDETKAGVKGLDCDEREKEVKEFDETKAGVEGLDCDECEKEVKRLDETKAGVKGLDCDEREKEVKEFDETKAGVKGLVDSGVTKIPSIFIHSPEGLQNSALPDHQNGIDQLQVPVIDLSGFKESERRKEIISDISKAAEAWGFFQIVNHGIPLGVMEEVLKGVARFHEQPQEAKLAWYSRDFTKKVNYYSNGDLRASTPADWRDTLSCKVPDDQSEFEAALPQVCRVEISEYIKHITGVQDKLSELLSEALGLSSDHLASMGCFKSLSFSCHYYPICPEPDLTLGITKHSDSSFITLLLQNGVGGLQVLHQNVWFDVPPLQGALVVNLGDWMQIISNDKFKSVEHRVLATMAVEPRTSVACYFITNDLLKPYGPIKDLISEINPPIYKDINFGEYAAYRRMKGQDGNSVLPHFRLLQ